MPQPNILFIFSDEHDPAVTGCYGDPLVSTPNLDRLSAEGITFDACYCNSPLCVPSRLSLTAGKYISRVGAWNNMSRLPSDDFPSLPRQLRQCGYTPYLCGKQHYAPDRRYGFEDLIPEMNRNKKNGTGHRLEISEETARKGRDLWQRRAAEIHPGNHSRTLDHDRKVTERATRFLREHAPGDGPFFLHAGYVAPHFPLIAPEEIYERYKGKVRLPDIPQSYLDHLLPNYRALRCGFGLEDIDPETTQRGRDLYWALTDWFDREVGKLLEALHSRKDADNTLIIYSSDHGENKGDHGLWWKNCHYDHGAQIPLIVSWPARWTGGQRRSEVCSLVDLVQTLVDLAGGSSPEDWDGDSLLPLLDNPQHPWKDFAVSEYYGHHILSGMTMYREGDWKYIYHNPSQFGHPPARELYNLRDDPRELQNRAMDPDQQERIQSMHRKLADELGEEPDSIEKRCLRDFQTAAAHRE